MYNDTSNCKPYNRRSRIQNQWVQESRVNELLTYCWLMLVRKMKQVLKSPRRRRLDVLSDTPILCERLGKRNHPNSTRGEKDA